MALKVELGGDNVPLVRLGDITLRLDLEELNEHDKERAKTELRETEENVAEAFAKFRKMVEEEENLYIPIDDEAFICKFLRPCKYYPESAFRLLKRFYKFKLKHPQYNTNLTPNNVRKVFDHEIFVFLPTRTETGARIMEVNVGTNWNPKEIKLEDMIRCVMVSIEIAMLEPKTQVGGVHVILNVQGLSLNHIWQFSPSMAKMIAEWVQECTPIRLKGIHVINQPYIFNMLFAIFKPFLGEKLKQRIFFHGTDRKSLCKRISPAALPPTLGGTANYPEYPGELLSEMLYYYEDDFKKYSSYGYKEVIETD